MDMWNKIFPIKIELNIHFNSYLIFIYCDFRTEKHFNFVIEFIIFTSKKNKNENKCIGKIQFLEFQSG